MAPRPYLPRKVKRATTAAPETSTARAGRAASVEAGPSRRHRRGGTAPAGGGHDDDDDNDYDDDEQYQNEDDQKSKKRKRQDICHFCKSHEQGQLMHQTRPCDWSVVKGRYQLECQNCADWRFMRMEGQQNLIDNAQRRIEEKQKSVDVAEEQLPSLVDDDLQQQLQLQWVAQLRQELAEEENGKKASEDAMEDVKDRCKCEVGPQRRVLWERYSVHHPAEYGDFACKRCREEGWEKSCDADPFLGLKCTRCVSTKYKKQPGRAKSRSGTTTATATGAGAGTGGAENEEEEGCPCIVTVGDKDVVLKPKPNLRQGFKKWFRHECEICRNLVRKKNAPGCSWLKTRTSWEEPCDRCLEGGLICFNDGNLLPNLDPKHVSRPPTSWKNTHMLEGGWLECRGSTPFRKNCQGCLENKNHCRAMAAQASYACSKCFQIGVDCRDAASPDTLYPLYDLSRVGIGQFCSFSRCKKCREKNRNCDRQRPCDSCYNLEGGDQCDCDDLAAGINCIKRLPYPPGPLYYLAHGYGAEGVNDVKDGSKLEHWIGPLYDFYKIDGDSRRRPAARRGAGSRTRRAVTEGTEGGPDADADADADAEADAEGVGPAAAAAAGETDVSTSRMILTSLAENLRQRLCPQGMPPLGVDEPLSGRPVSQYTVEDIREVIRRKWEGSDDAFPPNQHPQWSEALDFARSTLEQLADPNAPRPTLRTGTRRVRNTARPPRPRRQAARTRRAGQSVTPAPTQANDQHLTGYAPAGSEQASQANAQNQPFMPQGGPLNQAPLQSGNDNDNNINNSNSDPNRQPQGQVQQESIQDPALASTMGQVRADSDPNQNEIRRIIDSCAPKVGLVFINILMVIQSNGFIGDVLVPLETALEQAGMTREWLDELERLLSQVALRPGRAPTIPANPPDDLGPPGESPPLPEGREAAMGQGAGTVPRSSETASRQGSHHSRVSEAPQPRITPPASPTESLKETMAGYSEGDLRYVLAQHNDDPDFQSAAKYEMARRGLGDWEQQIGLPEQPEEQRVNPPEPERRSSPSRPEGSLSPGAHQSLNNEEPPVLAPLEKVTTSPTAEDQENRQQQPIPNFNPDEPDPDTPPFDERDPWPEFNTSWFQ